MAGNFIVELIAFLKKGESKKQVQADAKNLGDIKVPLVGILNKAKTRAQLKQDTASLNGTVNLTGKFNSKGVTESVRQATSQAQKQANAAPVQMSFTVKKEKLVNDIKLLAQQNSRLFKDADMSIKYNTLLDSAQMARNTVELSALRTQLGAFRSELKITGNAGLTMTDALRSGLSKVLYLFGSHGIIMQFTAQLRKAWTEAKELDSALTDLSRVNAEISRSDFPDYLDKVISKTKELSVATKDYIEAVTTFSKAGYNLADSEILADAAVQLEKVGDMSATDASKALLAGLQGYTEIDGYGMDQLIEKAQALNDKIDIIGNTASITQAEVAQGIQAVGSVMNDANTSVDEFISLLAAGNRAVQDSNKVALAIRTSALRIRGCTVELQEMGEETDNVIESTSTLAAKIKALTNINGSGGVDILEADEETFRSIYDIYDDIAKVYDKMSDTDASALLDLIAGKNRSNQISAILQNMSEANELLERSLNAAGTASNEYQIYLDSAEAATERFGVAMTETYNNILNGETVKGLTQAGTAVLDFANKWGIVEGSLKGILGLGILKGITTLTVAFKNSALQVSNYGSALNTVNKLDAVRGTQKYAEAMNTLKSSCVNLTDAQLKQVLSNNALNDTERVKILQYQGVTQAQAQAKLAQLGLTQTTNAQTAANGAATASTFSLKAAVTGLGASIKKAFMSNPVGIAILAISTAIGFATSAISKYNQKLEDTRRKAAELAEAYKQQQSSLDSQIEKYKELKESLDSDNLSTDEARSIKEQLLEIQDSLVESYSNEASNIDLLNGKYREQLGLLSELSKEKANDFIIEHRDVYNKAKKALEAVKTYDLGTVTSWSNIAPQTEEQKKLIEFIKSYSDLLELSYQGHSTSYGGNDYVAAVNLSVKANVADADEIMHQFATDLEQYGKDNNIDVSGLLEGISGQLKNTWTDELREDKEIYDEFMKAEIVRSDTLRPLYRQSIQAVEDYNKALSSAEGVEEAKANLDSVQQSVQNATGELEGSQEIFDDIYDGINKNAESAYNLAQSFEKDESVKGYAEQLRGLTDIDLKAINFEDNVQSSGEEAFGALINILGLSEDEIQNLIDKLVELGYVQGEVKSSRLNDTPSISLSIADTISQLNTRLKPAMDSLKSAWQDIFTKDGFALNSIDILSTCDSIKSKLDELNKIDGVTVDYSAYEDFIRVLSNTESTEKNVEDAFNSLATSITQAALSGTEDFETMKAALEDLGVVNSEIVAFNALIGNTEALKEAGLDLATATYEQISAFASEYVSAENLAQAINMLKQQKMLNALEEMDTSTEVANMISLAKKAGMTSDVIENLTELERIYQEVAKGTLSEYMLSKKLDRAKELKQLIEAGITKVNYSPEVDFNGVAKSASSAASSAAQSFTDLLDKELNVLDKKMEAGYIDFNDYIKARLDLIEDYYRQGKLAADEYYSYLEKHYKQELSYKDKVIKAVTRRIDKEIDKLEKQKDDIESYYKVQIDALTKEKTLLQDANKERQRQIDLQKAMYELERARNQRTKLIYSEDRGMHYVADEQSIRSAQQEAENAEFEIKIAEIEKAITKLEEARDKETEAIDAMIDKLKDYRDQWNNITSAYEEAQEDLIAQQMLGRDWEKDILDTRLDTLNKFKDDYIAIQQAMVDAAYQAAQAIAKQEKVKIGDSSGGSNNGSGDSKHGYEVVDEENSKTVKKFSTKKEADECAEKLNKDRAQENGMTIPQFNNSNIPGYYVKKYHTGLKQGLVDKHSFDDDFKLVQEVGLGDKEVPAILKEGEAVVTPEQISNIANGLSVESIREMQKRWSDYVDNKGGIDAVTGHIARDHSNRMNEAVNQMIDNSTNVVNNSNVQQPVINGGIHITCPGITSQEVARQVGAELNNMFNGFHNFADQQSRIR